MAQQVQEYAVDDWVVHLYYGVGQIKEIDVKPLNGEEVQCYRVKTENSTFWVPVDQADNPRLRPIASQEKVKQVFEVFKDAPKGMDSKHKKWKRRIQEVKSDGSFSAIATFVRDLTARSMQKKLNYVEDQALKKFKDRLVTEWSLSTGMDVSSARTKLHKILQENLSN